MPNFVKWCEKTNQIQSSHCTTITRKTQKLWPLLTGGRSSEVIYAIKVQNGGRCRQVVVGSGLTVLYIKRVWLRDCHNWLNFFSKTCQFFPEINIENVYHQNCWSNLKTIFTKIRNIFVTLGLKFFSFLILIVLVLNYIIKKAVILLINWFSMCNWNTFASKSYKFVLGSFVNLTQKIT